MEFRTIIIMLVAIFGIAGVTSKPQLFRCPNFNPCILMELDAELTVRKTNDTEKPPVFNVNGASVVDSECICGSDNGTESIIMLQLFPTQERLRFTFAIYTANNNRDKEVMMGAVFDLDPNKHFYHGSPAVEEMATGSNLPIGKPNESYKCDAHEVLTANTSPYSLSLDISKLHVQAYDVQSGRFSPDVKCQLTTTHKHTTATTTHTPSHSTSHTVSTRSSPTHHTNMTTPSTRTSPMTTNASTSHVTTHSTPLSTNGTTPTTHVTNITTHSTKPSTITTHSTPNVTKTSHSTAPTSKTPTTGTHSTGTHSTGTHSTGTHSTGTHSTGTHSTHSTGTHSTGTHSSGTHSTVTATTPIPIVPKFGLKDPNGRYYCILIQGEMEFEIPYTQNDSTKSTNALRLPRNSSVIGSCSVNGTNNTQEITFSFYDNWAFTVVIGYNEEYDESDDVIVQYSWEELRFTYVIDDHFVNPEKKDIGKNMTVTVNPSFDTFKADNRGSFKCISRQVMQVGGVTLDISDLQYLAFGNNDSPDFPKTDVSECPADTPKTTMKPTTQAPGHNNAGAIVGGVVGGIAGLVILIGAVLYCRKQRRANKYYEDL